MDWFTRRAENPIEKHFATATRYHYYIFFLLFAAKWPTFWHVLSLIFLSPPMKYTCDGEAMKCPCANPEWDKSVFTETIQTKYNILCDTSWMISFSQSMVYVGSLVGAISYGFLADRFGRLLMFSTTLLHIGISGCLVAIMPNMHGFIAMRLIEGIGVGGGIVTGYVLCVEYCGKNYRETITALYHVPINLGHMTLPVVSYFIRHCDTFQLVLSIPLFFFLSVQFLIGESPKWLADKGNVTKAIKVMEKIARFNGKPPATVKADMEAYYLSRLGTSGQTVQKVSFWKIFKYRKLTINMLCMSVIYMTCGMGYYGVSQYISQMSGNIHMNVAISGALLLPATIVSAFLLKACGRRPFLMSTSFLSGIFLLIVVFIPDSAATFRVAMACIGNCFFFISFITVFLYGVELFPTSIRNSVLGLLSMSSRFGQIIAPIINSLPQTVSGLIFGCMAIAGGILCIPLPETKNIELPSSLEEASQITGKPPPKK